MTAERTKLYTCQHPCENEKGGRNAPREKAEYHREQKIRHAPPGSIYEIIRSKESTREHGEMDQTASSLH